MHTKVGINNWSASVQKNPEKRGDAFDLSDQQTRINANERCETLADDFI